LEFEYQPHYGGLPDELTKSIAEHLKQCHSEDDIKAVFAIETVEPQSEILILAAALEKFADAHNG